MDMHGISQAFRELNDRNKKIVSSVETKTAAIASGEFPLVKGIANPLSNVNWTDILKTVGNIAQFIPGIGQFVPLITQVIAVVEEIQAPGTEKKKIALDIIRTALTVYNTVGKANIDVEATIKTISPVIDLIINITNTIHKVQQ